MNRSTLPRLTPEQREALKTWVRVGGGRLWIADAGWKEVVQSMGFRSINDSENEDFTGLRWRTEGFGRLLLSDGEFIKTITYPEFILSLPNHGDNALHHSFTPPRAEELRPHRNYRYGRNNVDVLPLPEPARSMIRALVKIPVTGYLICSLNLAILIGPVNLIFLKRRRKTILFCFTAPLIAIAGVLVLMLYSVLSEGLGVKLRERAVLWHDLDQGDGMIYQERALYSGLSRGELSYPAASLVSAWRSSSATINLRYQMDSRLTLLSGWLPSRTPAGIFTLTPIRPRLGLEVVHRQGSLYLVNHLDHTVREAWVTDDGSRYRLVDLAPGGEKILVKAAERPAPSLELFSLRPADITARMEGLPYQEDGGVTGEVLGGEYWYLATRNREAPLSKAATEGKGALPQGPGGRRR